jgi:hypothetical protein
MLNKLICMATLLVMGSVSLGVTAYTGFNSSEDGSAYVLGNINGQGSAVNDWAGAWSIGASPTNAFVIASGGSEGGTGDQQLAMIGATSGGYVLKRPMDAWSGDFEWSFEAKLGTANPSTTCQQQLEGGTGGVGTLRPLNIKWEADGTFKVNDMALINYVTPGGTYVSMRNNWVSVKIICNWAAATFDLYWERTDGSLGFVGQKVGWKDAWQTTHQIGTFRIDAPKEASMWVDNIHIGPPVLPVVTEATNPSPANGAVAVPVNSNLNWTAGDYALSHDVYLGTSYNVVYNAQRLLGDITGDGPVDISDLAVIANQWLTNPGEVNPSADIIFLGKVDIEDFAEMAADWHAEPNSVFKGNQMGTTYDPVVLAENTIYYWRVDEVNAADPDSPWKGNVWSFRTVDPSIPITIISPTNYTIQDGALAVGELVYIDRDFTFSNVASLAGSTYIKTANGDKASAGNPFLSFNVNQNVVVYVAHDDKITTKPAWLASFMDTGEHLTTTDSNKTLSLFAKEFNAGIVGLGGNEGGSTSSMYSVVITSPPTAAPAQAGSPSPMIGATGVSPNAVLSWTPGADAFSHDVYFGASNPPAYRTTQTASTYNPADMLEYTTYYWRIDETNSMGTTTGTIWSFTTGLAVAPQGTIIVDPTNSSRMVYSQVYQGDRLKPAFFAGPGDPEDFFYNNTAANISLLTSRGARCTYITAVLQDFGGGNPGTGAALDTKLNEWENYITQMENAGIVTVFFFFDDSQGLTSNWQELVDKCVAKFKHHKLLIWSVAEEYGEALTAAQVSQVAARIKAQDTNKHVVGVHKNNGNSFSEFLADANIDMFLMQLNNYTPSDLHTAILNSNARGTKILNMAEAEDHAKKDRTTVRQMNWAAAMAGVSAVQVLWMGRASDPADWNDPLKYDDCARLTDFMQATRLNETTNRNDLKYGSTSYVLANPGQVYILYGTSGTSLGANIVAGSYLAKWFDPVSGAWADLGLLTLSAGNQNISKPGTIGAEAALYLEKVTLWSSYRVEAENYTSQTGGTWVLDTAVSGYSGTGYLRDTRTGTFVTPTSSANYQVYFPQAGTYYCYIRYYSLVSSNPDASYSNGFHLDFDGVRQSTLTDSYATRVACYSTKEGAWRWATQWQYGESDVGGPLSFVVNTPGTHTISVVTRDHLFKFDRLVITNYKVNGQDYSTSTSPSWLETHMNAIPAGYN